MLENTIIKIRNNKNNKKINIYFTIISVLVFSVSFIIVPDLVKYLIKEGEAVDALSVYLGSIWMRGLPGLLVGLVFAGYGIKKFDPALRISLIRFFLLTFMLLVAIFYLLTRS